MHNVAGSKNAGHARLEVFIYKRTTGNGVQGNAGFLGKLVFGDQADGQQKRIAGDDLFSARNKIPFFIHCHSFNGFYPIFADNFLDCMIQLQRDAPVIQTLNVVSA